MKLVVSIQDQRLRLQLANGGYVDYPVSTALNGPGEQSGSGCTPRGRHSVRIVIGRGLPANTVFVGRRPTGELYSPELGLANPERDWILCRILWLQGQESGFNRGGQVDSLRRYIYIHGTPDTEPMGIPLSHGCIRMRNSDLVDLAELVSAGTEVMIQEEALTQ